MAKKCRFLMWGSILLIGVSLGNMGAVGMVWAQVQVPEDVVVMPQPIVRAIGDVFRDCPICPEMVILPPGSFLMGWSEPQRGDTDPGWEETPHHPVTIGQPIAVGRYEVTFDEWDACVAEKGCYEYDDEEWGRANRPVINVDWDDVQGYLTWLSNKTGKPYRLLSEAEWEYAARAGTTTTNYWGADNSSSSDICSYANVGSSVYRCSKKGKNRTVPVGSFRPNRFGLYDMIGNVQEWTADCWHENYEGAPSDGSAWEQDDCTYRVTRGGSWDDHYTRYFRSASRRRETWRRAYIGFRVARTMVVMQNPDRQ